MDRQIAVVDAPSNLGLRPPSPGVVPGCYKLAGALRDCGLVAKLHAEDAGCVTPPRYDRHGWKPGDGVANAAGLTYYTPRLADRVASLLDAGRFPVVLGGDCSILLGAALALRRRGRYGLTFLDGHSDFRHPGNAPAVGSAAGEDLGLVTGRGQADLTDLEGRRPYVRDDHVAVVGIRDDDEYLEELRRLGIPAWPVTDLRATGPEATADATLTYLERSGLDGFWLHLDVDILDPYVMPAVDSPDPGGIDHQELFAVLSTLLGSARCVGLEVTVFDPDLDPDGRLAAELTDTIVAAVRPATARSVVGGGYPAAAMTSEAKGSQRTKISLLGVPSAAGTHGPGQEKAPQALRSADLVERLHAVGVEVADHGDLPAFPFTIDPANRNQQNLQRVVDVVRLVAAKVDSLLDGDGVPLIIGGDCTITLGVVAAYARRYPDLGLMYFDGDIDMSTPDTTASGILDTMGMAHLLGHGAPALAGVGSRHPLIAGDHIVAFGYDEREPSEEQQRWLAAQGVACYPSNRMDNPGEEAARALTKLAERADPVLVHFDVDVVDSTDFPLANFPHFNEGLDYDDAITCLRTFCSKEALGGLILTEINPDRDPSGVLIDRLVKDLTTAVSGRGWTQQRPSRRSGS